MIRETELSKHLEHFRQLAEPGEALLAVASFAVAHGHDRLERPPDTRSATRKAAEAAAVIALHPVIGDPPSLARMLGGTSAAGQAGSWAARLLGAYRARLGSNRAHYLLVSDRRLVLASRRIFGKDPDYAVAFQVPATALTGAANERRPLARGRVVIRFADGSMIALKLGTWRAGRAQRLVQALTSPGTVQPLPL